MEFLSPYLTEWLSVIARWLHLITGIAWIGASFHFVFLDNSLEEPSDEEKAEGVKGSMWAIHGGGIYNFSKYQLAPSSWPVNLHWSKWEAYTTWMTGMVLMIAVYYFQAQSYLVGPDNWISDPTLAILASLGFIFGGLAIYEIGLRTPLRNNEGVFAIFMGFVLLFACWLSTQLFSDRAAFLHVGALMGSIMAGNVFLGIIPTQKRFVTAVEQGIEPSAEEAAFAKQRSMFNNYFTLPVLFCMISNHYPFLYGHEWNWVVLASILAITAWARHFFNLRLRGIVKPLVLVQAFLGFLILAGWLGFERYEQEAARAALAEKMAEQQTTETEVLNIVAKHCTGCHAVAPTLAGFTAAPGGIVLETLEHMRQSQEQAKVAISTNYMPLANMTGMSDEERAVLLNWLDKAD